ncbi:hypothetical protein HYV49_03105 [Candidatus Pacearchaeota archaeon]|nr:hypothetical protein [Candidatus Pacearchaeota archaeon]
MKRQTLKRDLLFPERNVFGLLRDYQSNSLSDSGFLHRAIVVSIDQLGGALEDKPKNPKNSIKARIISDASHSMLNNDDLPVFWPLFPFDTFPLKEGEHVYVIFENEKRDHGLWLTRIPEPFDTDNRNLALGIEKYKLNQPDVKERQVQDLEKDPEPVNVSPEFTVEKVPVFSARIGDRVIEGSNNTIIVLGRDRSSDKNSGQKDQAGSIDIVVGRSTKNDMDLINDKARIYISMNTDVDDNFGITDGTNAKGAVSIAISADEIRIVAKKDMKLIVKGDVLIGEGASEAAVLGDTLKEIISSGPIATLGSIPLPAHPAFINNLSNALSKTVKVKK